MSNRDIHWMAGAAAGGGYAAYLTWEQPTEDVVAETAGGLIGGAIGGLLPDWIDAPTSPRHRAEAHSIAILGTGGYFLRDLIPSWQSSLRCQAESYSQIRQASAEPLDRLWYGFLEFLCRLIAGACAGLLAGYSSHLALYFLTPASLPLLC